MDKKPWIVTWDWVSNGDRYLDVVLMSDAEADQLEETLHAADADAIHGAALYSMDAPTEFAEFMKKVQGFYFSLGNRRPIK